MSGNTLFYGEFPYAGFGALTFDGAYFCNLNTDDGMIHKLEIREGLVKSILDSFSSSGPVPVGLAYDGTFLWNASAVADKIYKMDLSGTIV